MTGLINYIPEPIRKIARGFKDKVVSLFKTNTPKQTEYGRGKKPNQKHRNNLKKSIINLFILKKENKEIKDRILEILGRFLNNKMIIISR